MDAVWAALVSGGLALIGTVITVNASQKKTQASVESTVKTEMAVMNTKIENLTKEVEKHNNFAVKIPEINAKVTMIKEECDQKFERLEGFHMHP